MILRRFMKHITDQNWFAVGLDMIVVITGIFFGMQLTDWNEERNNRVLESSYYQQLILDLKADQEITRYAINENSTNHAHGQLFYQALTEDDFQISDPNKFAESVLLSRYHTSSIINRQTYEELTNTGNLRLLVDVDLKREIVGYYQGNLMLRQWDMTQSILHASYVELAAKLISPEVTSKLTYEVEVKISDEEARKILETAHTLPNLKGLLTTMINRNLRSIRSDERKTKRIQNLIELLEKKLEDS
ncbi:MAG: hypothetical protein OEY96_11570 [Gammaproteobacteria bacterium]|nr:hypothetical protein [Gammaproteobacteria bacterium]